MEEPSSHFKYADYLAWDSDFFGFAVARLTSRLSSPEHLASALEALRAQDIRLVYWNTQTDDCLKLGKSRGGTYLGQKLTYSMPIGDGMPTLPPLTTRCESLPPFTEDADLSALAIACGEHSRFSIDLDFPAEGFSSLYIEWMRRSVARELASDVLIIRSGGKIAAVVTVAQTAKMGEIGLLAVGRSFRGNHFGESLVLRACCWFAEHGCNEVRVVTQAHNVAACRLYEKCGFKQVSAEHVFHFWLSRSTSPFLA